MTLDEKTTLLEKALIAIGAGSGGILLSLLAYWRRLLTRKEHDQKCGIEDLAMGLDEAITKEELDEALKRSAKETDLKLEAIKTSVVNVDGKIDSVKDALNQVRIDLSGKLGIVVSLLTGKRNSDIEI